MYNTQTNKQTKQRRAQPLVPIPEWTGQGQPCELPEEVMSQ